MAGLKIMANVRVQALQDYTLRVKIDNAQLVTLNGEIELTDANRIVENGGANSDSLRDNLPPEFKRHLETTILVNLKRGVVEEFFVAQDEPMSVTNIKRSLLSQLQLDISGSQQAISRQGSYHKVLEESVLGKCYTMYNVIPLTPARVMELERSWYDEESMAKLQPSIEGKKACENKQYYEIIKTRDLDHCTFRPMFQHVAGAEFSGDASKSRVGNLMTHMSSSTIYVCGELSSFNIRKIVVDDQFVANPIGFNTEQTEKTRTRIVMELIKKMAISQKLPAPTASRKETTLVYTYPEQRELENQMSAEVVQNTQAILETRPVLPQPKLEEAPKSLIPTGVPNNQIISQIVHEMMTISKKVYESPESCTQELDISGRVQTISKLMQVLSLQEIEQVWTKTLAAVPEPNKKAAKYLIIDTAAMVGTNPATLFVFKKIDAAQMCFIKATATIQSAMKSIRTPTKELVAEILRMVKQWKNDSNQEKKKLLTPTVLQLSNLIYHAYINPSTMVSNYPVRIYGIFGTEHSPVVNEYVSFLKQWLEQTEQDPKRAMKPVIVTALGKLGLLDAVKPILKVAQGVNQEESMYRSLAVHSLKRTSVRYPEEMKEVLLAIINNPVEDADVRIAAISILPWAQPSYVELQQIAIRSWYDRSNHVSSYARSTLMSLIHTEVPELKAVAAKARTVIHLFKATHYGLQLAKNFQVSKFVRYLLSSVNTEIQVVQTKNNLGPSKVSVASDVIMEVLGEGLRVKMDSWSVYSQGLDTVIDHALKLRAIFGDVLTTSPMVDEELKKMAEQIKLNPRDLLQYKSFIQSHNFGYEYAWQLTFEQIAKLISELKQSNIKDDLARGVKADFVTSANLLFAEFLGPNELGLPMIARKDLVSILAAKAYAQTEPQGYGMKAGLIPVWNIKQQSDTGIVAPFKICSECRVNGFAGQGVSVSLHTSLPIEVTARVSKGELEIELQAPEQSMASRTNHEVVHGLVTPYTVRAPWATIVPLNKAQNAKEILSGSPKKTFSKHFNGLFNGQFIYESDNEFVDFYSYLEKIRQHSPLSLPMTLPFVSSVRKSSARLEINAAMSELKKATLKIKLFTQQPSELMNLISKPVEQTILQEIKSIPSLNTVHSMLPQSPVTIIKVEAAIKKGSEVKVVEGYAVVGYKQVANHQMKSVAAVAGKLKQAYTTYGIMYEGELKRPLISARWNKEKILAQNLELVYNGALTYGQENNQQGKEKISIATRFYKTQEQINSVQASPEFKKCQEEERAGRRLSPICIKVRNQAASLDRAEMEIRLPNTIYQSPVLSTIEDLVKANLIAHYQPMESVARLPTGQIKLDLAFARAGDLAHVVVKHSHEAYNLTSIRIPRVAQGVMPLVVRNPVVDVMEQKFTNKYAPASCRVEPSIIRTFDNRTYAYKINECEHVLLTDGQRILPVAVLTKTVSGDQKMVKILAGKTKVEIIPQSGSIKILIDGQPQSISQGATFVKRYNQTGDIIAEIRRYVDDVYHVFAPLQMMHVMTDGKSVEVIAPQLLKNRAIGLCGDMNGEEIADLSTPKRCIMQPKLVAISYMLNTNGYDAKFAQCHNIEQQDLAAYQREDHKCAKEEIVKTPILAIFERVRRMTLPLVAMHKVEKQMNKVCISKEKVKTCGGHLTSKQLGSESMKEKLVKYACVSAPSAKAESLKKRAMGGEALDFELNELPISYTKIEKEPLYCANKYRSEGGAGGLGVGYGSEFGSGIEGGFTDEPSCWA